LSSLLPGQDRPAWKRILELSKRLTGALSVADQHTLITEGLTQELGAKVDLWLTQSAWRLPASDEPQLYPPSPATSLMRRAVESREMAASPSGSAPRTGESAPTAVALPMVVRGKLLGAIQAKRTRGPPLREDEVDLLDCAASQFAIVLESAHQLGIEQWRDRQLTLVREVSAQIANIRDPDELAQRVTELILATFRYYYVALFVWAPVRQALVLRASASEPSMAEQRAAVPRIIPPGVGIVGSVAQSGEEIVAHDVQQEPRYRYVDSLPDTRAEVALPLRIEDRTIGVLDVQSDRAQALHKVDLLVLRALAESVAIAVDHAQMVEDLRRRADQFAVIAEVNRISASVLDQDVLLERVAALIHEQLEYPAVHLFTVDKAQGRVVHRAGGGTAQQAGGYHDAAFALDDETDIIPSVASRGETVLENDVSDDARFSSSWVRAPETRAELAIPLICNAEVLGVLDIQSDRQDAFDMDSYFMFRTLADSVAIALRNANLYRSERWRRQVADSMREVAGLLSSDLVLEELLDAILAELGRTLPCDLAAVCLLEDETLTLAAILGEQAQPDIRSFPSDASVWIAQALGADGPLIRPPSSPDDPVAESVDMPPQYSAIAAPLRAAGQQLGLLYLAHQMPGRYGVESQVIMSAFASYAAVAIENARVYQASQEQALISTVMLQVAEATQSLTTVDDVLGAIVRLAALLVGISRCAILLWDDSQTALHLAAHYGLSIGEQSSESWRLYLSQLLVFEDLILNRAPLVIHDAKTDERVANTGLPALGMQSILALPLLAQGEVLGIMLVDYRDDLFAYDTRSTVRDERLTIIQGIAHQAAATIENALLREAQEQDAYVSTALFQVAQTVASLSDLDDILGAIVRITPILVGVERCVLFLWDEDGGCFRPSHTYGASREAEAVLLEQDYSPGDFPLLDLTRESNDPLTYGDDGASFEQRADQTVLPPEFAALLNYAPDAHPRLSTFPLAVKGEVLGVMLLEEPSAPTRSRQKRIEIITGIAQQAAFALQNAQLQQERLGRERLERELQLAFDIQRTFIPDNLPEIVGWELAAVWRAARVVAGDFYDLIDLPGGKIGILIADVADKGMPAALLMVLTRTLVRAAVQETDSPARVLSQVNDLLVPDAKRGMFVTAFYAVLSPQDGSVVYANAGHTPAVLRRADGETVLLPRGGMALGVVSGTPLSEQQVELDRGDALVFSTDGVTEALSPEGTLYGLDRLQQAVQEADAPTASQLLEAVDDSVTRHIDTAPASDDLTLIVLRRQRETA
jgi:sigma-B regulation protein RsbU (phosphoserine phosphatase)